MNFPTELIAISSDTSLNVGDTALLTCVGYSQPDVQITWSRNGENITNASLISIYEEEVTRGGRRLKQSSLELCSVQSLDAGSYVCTVSNGLASISAVTQVFVSGKLLYKLRCEGVIRGFIDNLIIRDR